MPARVNKSPTGIWPAAARMPLRSVFRRSQTSKRAAINVIRGCSLKGLRHTIQPLLYIKDRAAHIGEGIVLHMAIPSRGREFPARVEPAEKGLGHPHQDLCAVFRPVQ